MSTKIVVPELGESVVEATVADWLKQEGDLVEVGEVVAVLETDKVALDIGAEKAGMLAHIERQTGEDVQVGDVLGVIEEGAHEARHKEAAEDSEKPEQTQTATPVAKRVAGEHGIDVSQITGSGPRGRVTREDVERQLTEPKTTHEPASSARSEERRRMSRRRRTIARRLVEAQHTAAMLTTFNEVDMSSIMALRTRRQDDFVERHGVKLGIASFFVRAAVGALKAFPEVNAEIEGDDIVLKYYYDIGIAIGAPEGLVVPVLRDADRKTFPEIESEIRDFAQRATDGKLTIEELRGGTFTITNGGVFGSLMSTPILNPPQVGILGLHKIEERPVAVGGEVVIRPMMYMALSYDHRIIDGREAVQFLVRIKELIEDPDTMLLES